MADGLAINLKYNAEYFSILMPQYQNSLLETYSTPSLRVSFLGMSVKPFLKWPGGKRWIAKKLASDISARLNHLYFEPFLGGGAVFFALCPRNAILSDINEDLINVYTQVRDNPKELIEGLKTLPVNKENYYYIRSKKPNDLIEKAIRFLYLNRTAFGGIYRLNLSGEFNVPFGGGNRTPELLWQDGLIEKASKSLQGIELLVSDFEAILDKAERGDVVYCDPTYTATHNNNGFIRYNNRNFSWDDQERLASAALRAYQRGALVIVSNAKYSNLHELYNPFSPKVLTRKSLVSRKPEARREVDEYLFVLDPDQIIK
jgi:DNA adenine methylase